MVQPMRRHRVGDAEHEHADAPMRSRSPTSSLRGGERQLVAEQHRDAEDDEQDADDQRDVRRLVEEPVWSDHLVMTPMTRNTDMKPADTEQPDGERLADGRLLSSPGRRFSMPRKYRR